MSSRVEWSGLQELRAALRSLPADLTDDGADFVEEATDITETNLRQSYPIGDTGKLRAGVRSEIQRSPYGVIGIVKSMSPHAHLWEFGSQVRATRLGWNRGRGPGHHREGLIPIAQRNRRRMHGQLVELVRQAGFQVSGGL